MKQMTALWIAAALCLGCDGGNNEIPKGSGRADVLVTVPTGQSDGIMLVVFDGANILSFTGGPGQLKVVGAGTDQLHAIVRGAMTASVKLGEICVSSIEDKSSYSIQVVQVAAGSSQSYAKRVDLTPYNASARFANWRQQPAC